MEVYEIRERFSWIKITELREEELLKMWIYAVGEIAAQLAEIKEKIK